MKGKLYKITDFSDTQCKLSNISHLHSSPWWPDVARRLKLSMRTLWVETDPDGEVRKLEVVTVP